MSTIIKSKARVFGESINSFELLQALRSPLLKDDDAPIQISTQFHSGLLNMIYVCPFCHKIHLSCAVWDKNKYEERTPHLKVYADHTKDGKHVTKKELISVLEQLNEVLDIFLESAEEDMSYTLTKVFKCSPNCSAIHLDSAYERNSPHLN